jgi:hypothetical protein
MTDATLTVLVATALNPDSQPDVLTEAFHAIRVEQYLHRVYGEMYCGEGRVMGQ